MSNNQGNPRSPTVDLMLWAVRLMGFSPNLGTYYLLNIASSYAQSWSSKQIFDHKEIFVKPQNECK